MGLDKKLKPIHVYSDGKIVYFEGSDKKIKATPIGTPRIIYIGLDNKDKSIEDLAKEKAPKDADAFSFGQHYTMDLLDNKIKLHAIQYYKIKK